MTTRSTVWDGTPWNTQPALESEITADVCVVGLGGSGLAAVDELAALGVNVVGLDASTIGQSAAGRNGGFLLAGMADFYHRLVDRVGRSLAEALYRCTIEEIVRMRLEFPAIVRQTGSLRIAADEIEAADCDAHLASLRESGFPAERYSGLEGHGVLIPCDGVYQPRDCLHSQASRLVLLGVPFFENSRVTEVRPGLVATAKGRVRCASVIVAVDGGLERVLPVLAGRVRTARLQMLSTAPVTGATLTRPVYRRDGYDYWQQLRTGEIALGGFRDRGGEAEWTNDTKAGGVVQDELERFLRVQLLVTAQIAHRWAASVSYTEDRLPILEEVAPRVIAVGAYSGTGNIVGRLGGRAAARLACGVPSGWAELIASARQRAASTKCVA